MKNILITGITGQDGIFLSSKILQEDKNISIYGTSRARNHDNFYKNLKSIGVKSLNNISIINLDLFNEREVSNFINDKTPTAVYNLSGPSSVYNSINKPEKTISEITSIFGNLTSSLIKSNNFCNFFQASSSEMFESKNNKGINESSHLKCNSPYAEAKLINHNKVLDYSIKYNWNIVSGIMFNHESEFRDKSYLTRKIIDGAFNIYKKKRKSLTIGNLEYIRDWSFAGDTVNAMHLLNNQGAKGPYIIGSGEGHKIKDMLEIVFNYFNLSWQEYIEVDKSLLREGDPLVKISDPSKIFKEFGWKTETNFESLLDRCISKNIFINSNS